MDTKTIFISYSWDDEAHKEWVLNLANNFVNNGIDVLLDQYDLSAGKEMTFFMEKAMTAYKVLLVLTPNYKLKADKREGGVGYEYSLLSKEYYDKEPDKNRIIPILKSGDEKISCPTFVQSRIFHDMRDQLKFDSKFFELIKIILDKPLIKKPQLGKLPNLDDETMPDVEKAITNFKEKEALHGKKYALINSIEGSQLFTRAINHIIQNISSTLENYKNNFNLAFHIKTTIHPASITFSAGNYTFSITTKGLYSSTASDAVITTSFYQGITGFDNFRSRSQEVRRLIYEIEYTFSLDDSMNPLFISKKGELKLNQHEMVSIGLRDLILNEIKFKESKFT